VSAQIPWPKSQRWGVERWTCGGADAPFHLLLDGKVVVRSRVGQHRERRKIRRAAIAYGKRVRGVGLATLRQEVESPQGADCRRRRRASWIGEQARTIAANGRSSSSSRTKGLLGRNAGITERHPDGVLMMMMGNVDECSWRVTEECITPR